MIGYSVQPPNPIQVLAYLASRALFRVSIDSFKEMLETNGFAEIFVRPCS